MRYGLIGLLLAVGLVGCGPEWAGEGAHRVGVPSPSPAATPRPPRVGGGSATANPTVTPSPEPTAASAAWPSIEAVTPSVVATQALSAGEAQMDEQPPFKRPGEGSIPSASTTSTDEDSSVVEPSDKTGQLPATSTTNLRAAIEASRWPPHLWLAVQQVVMCESRGLTTAVSPAGYRGLMQVAPWLHGPVPADAVGQLNQAFDVWRKQGWQAWPICGAR